MLISAREDPNRVWQTRLPAEEVMLTAVRMHGQPTSIVVRVSEAGGLCITNRGRAVHIKVLDAHTIELLPVKVEDDSCS